HPQSATHMARMRTTPLVNVLLGPTLPRPNRSPEEHERWARAMLILFKPWRTVRDLKTVTESWTEAHSQFAFSEASLQVMRNMQAEFECKDARDSYEILRRSAK
ncbi:hypothetical protein R3P38DRAFT_2425326, partial [Favolaschia claudopus]